MKPIVVIATLTLKERPSESLLEALKALHALTHKEDRGCLQYDLHKDNEKANTYVFIETWENESLLNEHMSKTHFRVFQAALEGRVESLSVQKLEKIL